MISSADIYLFDEPTSGLSSKDSEHVIEIIRGLAHNKIVLVVIHQPSQRLFQMFNKAILLDRGGKMVFHGSPSQMLDYFADAAKKEKGMTEEAVATEAARPEFAFDIIETPLHDLSGEVIVEEASNGQLIPARRFSPDFWRDRYETHRLYQDMRQKSVRDLTASSANLPVVTEPVKKPVSPPLTKFRAREEWLQFSTLLRRAFLSKLRNVASLLVTLLAPPALAFIVGYALYFTDKKDVPEGGYVFVHAFHIPTYIFIALLVALFLALMNSVEDIIRDRVILQRERNLNVRIGYYITAKFLTLCVFSALQCALFVTVGNSILEVRGMFGTYFLWTFLTAVSGISLGLLVSALVPNSKTGAMLVPLILIPQLIFGGALIKYEEMNRDPDLLYSFNRFFEQKKTPEDIDSDKKLRVPFISRMIATHYSYEALVVAQAKRNPLASRQTVLDEMIRALAKKPNLSPADEDRLSDLKDTLAQLSGMEAGSAREIDRRLRRIDEIIAGSPPALRDFRTKVYGVTADQLYNNTKITDMVSKAESEQNDYRREYKINVFFSPEKHHGYVFEDKNIGWTTSVYVRNGLVLLGSSVAMLLLLGIVLHRQLNRSGV
jgi:ABC transport system ATP-binding/permease protein